jgi:hypothetical protein
MRVALATLVLALAALVPTAGAKEGVWAELVVAPPADAQPGSEISISWTLSYREQGKQKPFGAVGIFIRLLDAAHGAPTSAPAEGSSGLFRAIVKVPAGGIGGVQIGLHGTTDVFFPVRNDPYLRRPLHLPRVAPGARCPVAGVEQALDWSGTYGIAPGIGPGPAFPVGLASGVLRIAPAAAFHSRSWGGQKVLWFVFPSYTGPVLIRGARIDGKPSLVRFESGALPAKELLLSGTQTVIPGGVTPPKDARYRPSLTRLQGPGCYAYQIDGATFSRTIVFRAVRGS